MNVCLLLKVLLNLGELYSSTMQLYLSFIILPETCPERSEILGTSRAYSRASNLKPDAQR